MSTDTLDTFDRLIPGIRPGAYRLELTQGLRQAPDPASAALVPAETETVRFQIDAPRLRFAAPADEVHACYPPAGAAADYRYTLPHIVLKRRTLPWEHQLLQGDEKTPWLALLLLGPQELAAASLRDIHAAELLRPDSADLKVPVTTVEEGDRDAQITVLELAAAQFRALCPRLDELAPLSHVRQVSLSGKADAGPEKTGEFAVVLANRFPAPGQTSRALLVSLDGWGAWLGADPAGDAGKRVRVVVLHSWSFESVVDGSGTFRGRIEQLRDRIAPLAAPAPGTAAAVARTLAQGFVPLAYQPEGAAKTFGWYRGPLSPIKVPALAADGPSFEAVPDPAERGMDLSYSAAWQLGRLLALSSASFGAALRRWCHVRRLEQLRDGSFTPRPALSIAEDLRRYLEMFRSSDLDRQEDPRFVDAAAIALFLGDLLLLRPVPVRYLLPADALLPPESLRLFYVDPNWTVDALAAGALSLAAESVRAQAPLPRKEVRAAIWGLLGFYRQILDVTRKHNPGRRLPVVPEDRPISGFLLRSRLLGEFPGVEIALQDADASPLAPLRIERLNDDTLIVLLHGSPTRIQIKEPREGLWFGATPGWKLPAQGGQEEVAIQAAYLRDNGPQGPGNVVDVARLTREKLTSGDLRSGATFALRWLRKPTDMTLTVEHAP